MVANLTAKGRKLVIIIDPHIKREAGYFVHEDCLEHGYYVKDKDGKVYEGMWLGYYPTSEFQLRIDESCDFTVKKTVYPFGNYRCTDTQTVTLSLEHPSFCIGG